MLSRTGPSGGAAWNGLVLTSGSIDLFAGLSEWVQGLSGMFVRLTWVSSVLLVGCVMGFVSSVRLQFVSVFLGTLLAASTLTVVCALVWRTVVSSGLRVWVILLVVRIRFVVTLGLVPLVTRLLLTIMTLLGSVCVFCSAVGRIMTCFRVFSRWLVSWISMADLVVCEYLGFAVICRLVRTRPLTVACRVGGETYVVRCRTVFGS